MKQNGKRILMLAAIAALCMFSVPAPATQTQLKAEVALKTAMDRETVDGNLKAAIDQYKKIVATYAANHAVAAKALIRMGQCYEKLGDAEARKAYERVVREFADQAEIVAQARVRLAALGGPSPTTLTVRRLENPTADTPGGAISPDGRYVSFGDWRTGDLSMRDLQTGKDRRLTNEGTLGNEGSTVYQEAGGSTWSSDGKQIAYEWYVGSAAARGVELRVVGLDGGKPRVLTHDDGVREMGSFAWSPDGKHIVASVYFRNGPPQIVLTSTMDGSTRALTDLKREINPTTVRFSPDGRYVAYNRLPDDTSPERDIVLMSIDTGQETPLIQHPADDYLLGWSRDGKWIIFASDRTGALGLWVIGMSGFKTQGEPRLVKAWHRPNRAHRPHARRRTLLSRGQSDGGCLYRRPRPHDRKRHRSSQEGDRVL